MRVSAGGEEEAGGGYWAGGSGVDGRRQSWRGVLFHSRCREGGANGHPC
jgi:hypothetical protein